MQKNKKGHVAEWVRQTVATADSSGGSNGTAGNSGTQLGFRFGFGIFGGQQTVQQQRTAGYSSSSSGTHGSGLQQQFRHML
jgi:hypothetical protein